MADVAVLYRERVKSRLKLKQSDTAFDQDIDEYLQSAVERLFPFIQTERTDTVEVAEDEWKFTLPDGVESIRMLFDSEDHEISDFIQHDRTVLLRDKFDYGTLTIYGNGKFTLETLEDWLKQPIFWFAMAEFYLTLAADKAKYNIYMANGARQVDNMRDQSEYLEERANTYLQDRGVLLGLS
jgi:hypothetical protein